MSRGGGVGEEPAESLLSEPAPTMNEPRLALAPLISRSSVPSDSPAAGSDGTWSLNAEGVSVDLEVDVTGGGEVEVDGEG